jgi:fatty acid desaturase
MAHSLAELDCLERDKLVDRQGRAFKDVRRALTPRFARVWGDILLGYLALTAGCGAVALLDQRYPRAWALIGLAGAFPIAYFMAFIQLFFHEAAHYNLAATRRANDVLANLFIGSLTGQSIKAYRVVHFDHHRLLGTHDDTERSYFNALNARFLVESLLGIRLVRVFLSRRAHVGARAKDARKAAAETRRMLLLGLLVNASIMGGASLTHCWSLLVAWPFGMLVVHPAITALRQLLEHRRFDAVSSIDYGTQDQGVMTRMFCAGPIASTLGGAGFNRHLLHHWDPQLSYTRFAELERFLLETAAGDALRSVTTSYARAFLTLLDAP